MASDSPPPTDRSSQRRASFAVYGAAPAALGALWWLRSTGLIADTPIWVYTVVLTFGAVTNYSTSVLVHRDPTSMWRIHARVAASALATAATVYAVGWGSLLLVAYAVGSSELLRTVGSSTTRPNLWWNWIALAIGETAIHLGAAPTVVDRSLAHAVAITGAILLGIVTRVLGESAHATESAEATVRARARHFEALIAHATDLIGVVGTDGRIVSVSPAVTEMLGQDPVGLVGTPLAALVDPAAADELADVLARVAGEQGGSCSFELAMRHADGSGRLAVATFTHPDADWGDLVVMNIHDITTQRDLEVQLRHDARHDALTGLLNRKAFGEASERSCARAARTGRRVGMLYIDLDGFKQVNDSLGHDSGDSVLIEAGHRIEACLRSGETLARLGGDEFAVLIDSVDGDRGIHLAESIIDALGEPIDGLPEDMRVGASIGIALRSNEGIEFTTLMRDADAAMYAAKRNGRSRWEMTDQAPGASTPEPVIEV